MDTTSNRSAFLRGPITAGRKLSVGDEVLLEGPQLHQLRFRQVRGGEAFTLRDAEGRYFRARVSEYLPNGARCTVFEAFAVPPEPGVSITLLQAIPARERMFWIIEKATELGVDCIIPVFTHKSVQPDLVHKEKPHRWEHVALRAVRQCRRARVPEVHQPISLTEALELQAWKNAEVKWLLAGPGKQPPTHPPSISTTAIAVGPEGGWTEEEEDLLMRSGAVSISLTGRILRAETAAVVGIAAMLMLYGDLHICTAQTDAQHHLFNHGFSPPDPPDSAAPEPKRRNHQWAPEG